MGIEKAKLEIPLYRQTLPASCGTASMIMIESFFDPQRFPATLDREIKIHDRVSYFKDGLLKGLEDIAAIAALMIEDGFNVRYFVDGPRYRAPGIDEDLWERCVEIFTNNLNRISRGEKGKVINGNFGADTVVGELKQGRACICEIKYGGLVTHIVVARGVKGNTIYIADPLRGHYSLRQEELDNAMEQCFIKNFFSVWKDQ